MADNLHRISPRVSPHSDNSKFVSSRSLNPELSEMNASLLSVSGGRL